MFLRDCVRCSDIALALTLPMGVMEAIASLGVSRSLQFTVTRTRSRSISFFCDLWVYS